MAKLTLTDIASGFQSASAQNDNNTLIENAIENTLSLDGTTPNAMMANLDMNGYAILNQLATSGGENFSWEGNWTTGTAYVQNNLIYVTVAESATNGGSAYICTTDHTAGATFDGDLSANWTLLAKRGATGASGAGSGDLVSTNNLSDVTDPAASATNLGLGTGDSPQFTAVNVGHATDTTITRVSAGDIAVEGNAVYRAGGTDVPVADGGTGVSTLTDGGVLVGNGTGVVQATAVGTSGQVLTSNGAGSDPTFQDAGGGVWTQITAATNITAVANLDITFDETLYSEIKIVIEDAIPATDNTDLQFRYLYSNGASVETGSYYADGTFTILAGGASAGVGSAAGEGCSGSINIYAFATSYGSATGQSFFTWKKFDGDADAANSILSLSGATGTICRAYDGIRLFWSTGNFEANGTYTVYGLTR